MSASSDESTRHERVKTLFLGALGLPAQERSAWLGTAATDPSVRAEVEALLEAHRVAEESNLLEQPLLMRPEPPESDPMIGAAVGPWKLLEKIGAGGMGAVYRAVRGDGAYDQTVAVKLLKPGGDIATLAQRLRAERRLLARLEHPNIARLYDGGVTAGAFPYLALEFVEGETITAFARQQALDVNERLDLFLQVCDAVAYAHRNLIVHRDLKPSNIMVKVESEAADGAHSRSSASVKLLDFGIAKLLDDERLDSAVTRTGLVALTPAYAAPEQLRGEPVTTATDVYALGVVLFELLTDRRPFDFREMTAGEVEWIASEVEPPRPSAAAGEPRLRGDLDTIVLKTLEKEPDRRYVSADALAEDIRRHLRGLPVRARPPAPSYRVHKFVARNRAGVIAAVALVIVFMGGFIATFWQSRVAASERDRAERRFDVAREAAAAMLYDIHEAVTRVPGTTAANELILSTSLDYLNRLAEDASDDVALRIDLAEAYLRVGDVLGNPAEDNMGRIEDALASYRRGLALVPYMPGRDSLAANVALVRANLFEEQGSVEAFAGRTDDALVSLDSALASYARSAALDPGDPDRRVQFAIGHINRGDYAGHPHFPNAGLPDSAMAHYERAWELLNGIRVEQRGDGARRILGIVFERVGTLLLEQGRVDEALTAYRQSLELREQLGRRETAGTDEIRDLGVAYEKVGLVYQSQGRPEEALVELERAAAIYESLADVDQQSARARQTLAVSHIQRGDVFGGPDGATLGNSGAAARHYREALALLRPLAADSVNVYVPELIAEAEGKLAGIGGGSR